MTRETDPRALELLADGLAQGAPRELDRLLDNLLAQPHRTPAAFVWLAERAAVDEALRSRNPLRLLQQILASHVARRVRALPAAPAGPGRVGRHACRACSPISPRSRRRRPRTRCSARSSLEPYQREQLVNAIQLRFQTLRKETGPAPLYATGRVDRRQARRSCTRS